MMFSASAQVIIMAPILPEIGEALDTPESLLGWLATSYTVLLAVMAIVIGPVSDKFGRRRILMAGCATMAFVLYCTPSSTRSHPCLSFAHLRALRAAC